MPNNLEEKTPKPSAIDVNHGSPQVVTKTSNLPLFLAGPIVRRAEADKVWFWFASSEEITSCTPILYKELNIMTPLPLAAPELKVKRFGEHLWIVLVSASPATEGELFPFDTVIQYSLLVTSSNKNLEPPLLGMSADAPGQASTSQHIPGLNYLPYVFPTFTIAGKNRRLVHGSCRRQGGPGPDAFLSFDKWMAKNAGEPIFLRPHAMLLTGDQIFTQINLAEPLFKGVLNLVRDVFEYSESLPKHDGTPSGRVDYAYPGDYAKTPVVNSRKKNAALRNDATGFTTDDGQGHMLSFGEYCSLYLMGSNPELFKKYVTGYNSYPRQHELPMTDYPDSAAAARRVLANIATYNILDDHDVTDDWNLDAAWVQATDNPFGRRVISNALASAFAFQTWGNDPSNYDDSFIDIITNHTDALTKSGGTYQADDFEKTMLGRTWEFVAPTNPPTLCVDTRTQREYPDIKQGAVLSGPKAQKNLKTLIEKNNLGHDHTLLIVLATPLLLHHSAALGQSLIYGDWRNEPLPVATDDNLDLYRALVGPLKGLPKDASLEQINAVVARLNQERTDDKYKGDYELYPDNKSQRPQLIRFLYDEMQLASLVIFSGDVHHGFVMDAVYGQGASKEDVYKGNNVDWWMRVTQITSSPVKNMEKEKFVDNAALVFPDEGILGQTLLNLWELQDAQTADGRVLAMQATALDLTDGPNPGDAGLGRKSFIYENHFCVVDMPEKQGADLTATFVGARYQEKLGQSVGNYPGDSGTAYVTISTSNQPGEVELASWAAKRGYSGGQLVKIAREALK